MFFGSICAIVSCAIAAGFIHLLLLLKKITWSAIVKGSTQSSWQTLFDGTQVGHRNFCRFYRPINIRWSAFRLELKCGFTECFRSVTGRHFWNVSDCNRIPGFAKCVRSLTERHLLNTVGFNQIFQIFVASQRLSTGSDRQIFRSFTSSTASYLCVSLEPSENPRTSAVVVEGLSLVDTHV